MIQGSLLALLVSNACTASHRKQIYGLYLQALQPCFLRKLLQNYSNWPAYFFDFSWSVHKCISWHALEKYLVSSRSVLRYDSCIQVFTICKAKQALKPHCDMPTVVTEVLFCSTMPWVTRVQFLTLHKNVLWMCNFWASYMQWYKIPWLVNTWNVAYLLQWFPNLAAFLPLCLACSGVWLECVQPRMCWLSGVSTGRGILLLCLFFRSRSPNSRWKWLGCWGGEKMVVM